MMVSKTKSIEELTYRMKILHGILDRNGVLGFGCIA